MQKNARRSKCQGAQERGHLVRVFIETAFALKHADKTSALLVAKALASRDYSEDSFPNGTSSLMKVLGIMSGTSIDGVDHALCEVERRSIQLLGHWRREIPGSLRTRLHTAARGETNSHDLAQLHHDFGRLCAQQAKRLGVRTELIGFHGQTVFHSTGKNPATLQIGEPAHLVEACRVPVISNFRAADLAAGGQGAPLATLFHQLVFAQHGRHVCVNNLGGISNVTSIDWRGGALPRLRAFDTGPANVLLDLAVRQFTDGKEHRDHNGAKARRGKVSEKLLAHWVAHPFFKTRSPKSTGRELFGETFWDAQQPAMRKARLSADDVLATITELTARSIALNYRLHLSSVPHLVVLSGGGANNRYLVARIRHCIEELRGDVRVQTSTEFGWPVEAIEAAAFALLAFYRRKGVRANIPATTGAKRAVLLGQVAEP